MISAMVRHFVPSDLDPNDFDQLQPLYQQLLSRGLNSTAELETWLKDLSELACVVDEHKSRLEIATTRHTDDQAAEAAFLQFIQNVEPQIKPLVFALQQKYIACPHREGLLPDRFGLFDRRWQADVELFCQENISLQTEITRLGNEYAKICGAMTIEHDGVEYPLPQAARFLEDPDRTLRQSVWEKVQARRTQDRNGIDQLFEQLLDRRQRIAQQAGLADFREYIWQEYYRFDYTPEDCLRFVEAIEQTCVPLVNKLDLHRQKTLGVDSLRPWDLHVDPQHRQSLKPFPPDDPQELVAACGRMIRRVDPELGRQFASLKPGRNLDLDSRPGKAPGGYQAEFQESGEPFIFMNAAGRHSDVIVLLHEAGHALHFFAARAEPLFHLREPSIEFCEVASMSMELLGLEFYEELYSPEDAARARRMQMEDVLRTMTWVATIDSFQHWLYTHPGHSLDQRRLQWTAIARRFGGLVDWSGYEEFQASLWQRQIHLFQDPFYYIEYAIARLGSLQLWQRFRDDPQAAVADYRQALALGGTVSLPTLFATAGLRFDLSVEVLGPLMDSVAAELSL